MPIWWQSFVLWFRRKCHLRVNFWPETTGVDADVFLFGLPHMAQAGEGYCEPRPELEANVG